MPNPAVDVGNFLFFEIKQSDLAHVERRASTQEKQFVHELPEVLHVCLPLLRGVAPRDEQGVNDGDDFPEVAPSPGEHAGPNGLVHRQEPEDVLEDGVWQVVDAAATADLHRLVALPLFPRRHPLRRNGGAAVYAI